MHCYIVCLTVELSYLENKFTTFLIAKILMDSYILTTSTEAIVTSYFSPLNFQVLFQVGYLDDGEA